MSSADIAARSDWTLGPRSLARRHGYASANGILLCRNHHLRLHNDGWAVRQTESRFWLVPPEKLAPEHTPIALASKAHWMPGSP